MAPQRTRSWHDRLFSTLSPRELCIVGAALLGVQFTKAVLDLSPQHVDFAIFYMSAVRARLHLPMYVADGNPIPNFNPPHVHLIVLPFTILPLLPAFVAWTGATCALAWLVVRRAMRESCGPWSSRERWIVAAWVLTAAGVQATLRIGQVSWIVAAFVTGGWIAARRSKWIESAVWVGLAISVKPFLLVLLFVFLRARLWTALAISIASVPLWLGLGGVAFGWPELRDWVQLLDIAQRPNYILNIANASLTGVFARIGAPLLLARVAAVLILLVTAWRAWAIQDQDLAWLQLLLAALLASPLGWMYYAPLLVGPLIVLVRRGFQIPVLAALAGVFPSVGGYMFQSSVVLALTVGSVHFWSAFLLWVAAMSASGSRSRRGEERPITVTP